MKIAIVALALVITASGCSDDETINARFDDVSGLTAGSTVIVAGIEVGAVKSISVVDGQAQVAMEIAEGQEVTLHEGACARLVGAGGGRAVLLVPGTDGEFDADFVGACAPTLAERALELQNEAVRAVSNTAREAGRELTMTAAEFSAGLNEGSDELREAGNNLTMAGRAFAEGVEEGAR